jgi:UDP-glucose 4-epimerase
MRVLVTGAAGFIGRVTVRLLVASGHEVLSADLRPMPLDSQTRGGHGRRPRWRSLDVRSGGQVRSAVTDFEPDAIVHLAAKHFIPWCDRFPAATLKTNVLGTQNILDALRGRDRETRLVFASSAAVYGSSSEPLDERAPLGPDDVYGTSKAICEQLLALARDRDLRASMVALRLFNTIGPGDANAHLVPRLIAELRRDGRRVRVGNLESVRDYVDVEDVARAILAAVQAELPEKLSIANVGTGVGRTVGEVIETIGALIGRRLEVTSIASRRRVVDRPLLVADPRGASEILGWEARVPFANGLALALQAEGVKLEGCSPPMDFTSPTEAITVDRPGSARVLTGATLVGEGERTVAVA